MRRSVIVRAFIRAVCVSCLLSVLLLMLFFAERDERLNHGADEQTARDLNRRAIVDGKNAMTNKRKTPSLISRPITYDYRRIQEERKTRVQQICSAMGHDPSYNISTHLNKTLLKQFDFLLAIPDLKLIYCYIPKVSCTSWKRLLLALNGDHCFLNETCASDAHMLARKRFTRMSRLPVSSAKEIFATYTSFFFVRNPYSRVLSAYLEKVLYHPESKIQNELTDWFKENHPDSQHQKQTGLFDYQEFIMRYTAAGEKNQHWEDMHKLCFPCHINYDFIGNYETLKPDSDFILDLADAPDDIRFPEPQKKPTYSSDDNTLKKFYSQLSDDDLHRLTVSRGFATDATMFGYQIPDSIRRH